MGGRESRGPRRTTAYELGKVVFPVLTASTFPPFSGVRARENRELVFSTNFHGSTTRASITISTRLVLEIFNQKYECTLKRLEDLSDFKVLPLCNLFC